MSTAIRIERDRPSDAALVAMCLRADPPGHVNPIGDGWYAVDLPADVWRLVWIAPDHRTTKPHHEVRTYRNRIDRGVDIVTLFAGSDA